jgi:hypothetical protein
VKEVEQTLHMLSVTYAHEGDKENALAYAKRLESSAIGAHGTASENVRGWHAACPSFTQPTQPTLERARSVLTDPCNTTHIQAVDARALLCNMQLLVGDYVGAKESLVGALRSSEEVHGEDPAHHPTYPMLKLGLAGLCLDLNHVEEAFKHVAWGWSKYDVVRQGDLTLPTMIVLAGLEVRGGAR